GASRYYRTGSELDAAIGYRGVANRQSDQTQVPRVRGTVRHQKVLARRLSADPSRVPSPKTCRSCFASRRVALEVRTPWEAGDPCSPRVPDRSTTGRLACGGGCA